MKKRPDKTMREKQTNAMKENIRQLIIYLFVGGCATIVEWSVFYVLRHPIHMHYMLATAIAFILSTFANWIVGKWLLFQQKQNKIWKELIKIYATSAAGLLMNLLIMWIAIDLIGIQDMIAKIIATGIVFFWNFLVRKLLIYKI